MTRSDPLELPSTPTINVAQTAALFGVSKWALYKGAKEGTLPVQPLKVGSQLRWPTGLVLSALGLDREPGAAPAVATPRETDSGTTELHVTPAQRKLIIAALRSAVQPTAAVPSTSSPGPDAA